MGGSKDKVKKEMVNNESLYLVLKNLKDVIDLRAEDRAEKSYTASLLEMGVTKCPQKLGEEATETIIAALSEKDENLINEASDLIYHLLVLLKSKNIDFEDVLAELKKREGVSGHAEKAGRKVK